MEFFNVFTVKEVHSIIQKLANNYLIGTETVDLLHAIDRIVYKDIIANVNLPEFNRSTVDGYAVISQDVMGASESIPSYLQTIGQVSMGETVDLLIGRGQVVYVPTGGMVPEGADGVVMIEYIDKLDEQTILIYKPIAPGENMTLIGDDLKKGELVVPKGKKLSAYDVGLLAGMGLSKVEVYKKPKFAILSTGDEIIDLHEDKGIGQVRDINGYALNALIVQLGGEVVHKNIVEDDFEKLQNVLGNMLQEADIVLISGGSSVGTRDYTKKLIESFAGGEVLVHGVSIKPGKPTILGQVGGKIVYGLPGHPASALIIFNVFVKTYIRNILSRTQKMVTIQAKLTGNVHSSPGKETYQMVQLIRQDHEWLAVPFYAKSGMMTLLSKASGYIRITDEKEGIVKGEKVDVFLFQEVDL